MTNRRILPLLFAGFAILLFSMSAFIVRETELALKMEIGKIVRADFKPGLHFLVPFLHNVKKFDRRILTEDYPSEQFLTSEGKILKINFFVKWRINDVSKFYTSTSGGSEEVANRRVGEIVKDGIKSVIAKSTIQQVVAAERSEFLGEVLKIAGANVGDLGIALVDVRVKSIELPEEVSDSVFRRMSQDFARQAAQLRAEGSAVSEQTRAEADRQRTEILADAYRQAEMTKGEGDAQAADIYAKAHSRNPEFYAFYRSMQAYRRSLGKQGDILVVAPDGEFFKYLKESGR
jgi:membrane protease subunit HflC